MHKLSSHDRVHPHKNPGYTSSSVPWLQVVKASGPRIGDYLQGQLTQDISLLSGEQGIYAAALTPQGKLVSDLHLMQGHSDELLLIMESNYASKLVGRLRQFSIGFDLRIGIVNHLGIIAVQGGETNLALKNAGLPIPGEAKFATARVADVEQYILRVPMTADDGVWLVTEKREQRLWLQRLSHPIDAEGLQTARILHGFPRFGIDFDATDYPLNANFIERQGVSFDKGCYVGQELTSRMRWRSRIKHRLYSIRMATAPAALPAVLKTSVAMGRITSLAKTAQEDYTGIARLRIEAVEDGKKFFTETGIPTEIVAEIH